MMVLNCTNINLTLAADAAHVVEIVLDVMQLLDEDYSAKFTLIFY